MTNLKLTTIFVLFFCINIIGFIDRHLLSAFGSQIVAELDLTRQQFGLLTGFAFVAVYALSGPVMGVLADRYNPAKVVTVGVLVWSLMTAISGRATSFFTMLAPRVLVGVGEATLHPSATSIFTKWSGVGSRSTIFSLFFLGGHVGVGLAYWLAGTFGDTLGWRQLFLLLGSVGLLFCIPLWLFVAPLVARSNQTNDKPLVSRPSVTQIVSDLRHLLVSSTRFRIAVLGFALVHVLYATNQFMQLWLSSERGLADYEAASVYGAVYLTVAIPAGLLGGLMADLFIRYFRTTKYLFLVIVLLASGPLLIALRYATMDTPLFQIGLVASVFMITFPYGAMFAAVIEEVPARIQASGTGFILFACNVLVIGGVTWGVGALSDYFQTTGLTQPLSRALSIGDAMTLLAIPCFWWLHRHQTQMMQITQLANDAMTDSNSEQK